MRSASERAKVSSVPSMNGIISSTEMKITKIFGTNVSVCS